MQDSSGYSVQEKILQAEANGGVNPYRETHKRLFEILDTFNGMVPIVDIERARLFTASMKSTEGQPLILRWAKALKHIAENITVYVDDKQLLVGRCGTDRGRYGILYPELDGDILAQAMHSLSERKAAPIHVEADDVKVVMEEITPYWSGKTFHEELNISLPEDAHRLAYNDPRGLSTRFVVSETASYRSSQQWVLDYKKVIYRGFASIRAETQARLDALDPLSPMDMLKKKPFLQAVVITCDAIVHWAKRHAVLARQKAEQEKDPARKTELLTIAANCEQVP
ncbi:glycyl radical protein, partial [Desulfovibrio sp. OttesenSCG-928-C14]|nr:glycyl radical protein [Desulfovibrio sp. OttesenSCG-928-C14]